MHGSVLVQNIEGGGMHGGAAGIIDGRDVLRNVDSGLCHVGPHRRNIGGLDRGGRHMGSVQDWLGVIGAKVGSAFEREVVLLVDHRRFTFITTSPI